MSKKEGKKDKTSSGSAVDSKDALLVRKATLEALIKKAEYYSSKNLVTDLDLYYLIKDFFKAYLDISYEFSFDELIKELDKIYLSPAQRDEIVRFISKIKSIEYKNNAFSEPELKEFIKEFISLTSLFKLRNNSKEGFFQKFKNLFSKKESQKYVPSESEKASDNVASQEVSSGSLSVASKDVLLSHQDNINQSEKNAVIEDFNLGNNVRETNFVAPIPEPPNPSSSITKPIISSDFKEKDDYSNISWHDDLFSKGKNDLKSNQSKQTKQDILNNKRSTNVEANVSKDAGYKKQELQHEGGWDSEISRLRNNSNANDSLNVSDSAEIKQTEQISKNNYKNNKDNNKDNNNKDNNTKDNNNKDNNNKDNKDNNKNNGLSKIKKEIVQKNSVVQEIKTPPSTKKSEVSKVNKPAGNVKTKKLSVDIKTNSVKRSNKNSGLIPKNKLIDSESYFNLLLSRAKKSVKKSELLDIYKKINSIYSKETVSFKSKHYNDLMRLYKRITKLK